MKKKWTDLFIERFPVKNDDGSYFEVVKPLQMKVKLYKFFFLLLIGASLFITDVDLSRISSAAGIFSFFSRLFPISFDYLEKIWDPLWQTVSIAIVSTVFGSVLAFFLAVLSSVNLVSSRKWVASVRFVLSLFRAIPEMVWAVVFVAVFGVNETAGVLALTMYTTAFLSKGFYESIESINPEPLEVVKSVGGGFFHQIVYVVLPLSRQFLISYVSYAFEMNIRSASVIGYVGVGGLGRLYNVALALGQYQRLGTLVVVTLVLVLIVDNLANYVRVLSLKS